MRNVSTARLQEKEKANGALAIFRNRKSFPRSFIGSSVGVGLSVIDVVEYYTELNSPQRSFLRATLDLISLPPTYHRELRMDGLW